MAGIQDTNVIDVVAHDPAASEYMLVMVETRPWGADQKQSDELKAKINTYVNFVTNGELARNYPETVGQRIRLQLDCAEPPRGEFKSIVDRAIELLPHMGMRFVINVRG